MVCASQVIQLSRGHVADGWRRVLALRAYVDDSGSEPSSPEYVLGGVVLPIGWWDRIAAEWGSVLNAPPTVEYYKAAEVWDRSKGPFRYLSDAERKAKVDALADVLTEHHPAAFSIRVKWDIFLSFANSVRIHSDRNDPYFFLFYGMIAQIKLWAHKEPTFGPVDLIFDNQNEIGRRACDYYEYVKQNSTPETQGMLGKRPEFGDEKKEIPLQAADMFAWYSRRHALGTLYQEWNQNVWRRLSRYHQSAIMETETLESISRSLRILL